MVMSRKRGLPETPEGPGAARNAPGVGVPTVTDTQGRKCLFSKGIKKKFEKIMKVYHMINLTVICFLVEGEGMSLGPKLAAWTLRVFSRN